MLCPSSGRCPADLSCQSALIEAAASTALNSIISSACQPNNGLHERRMYGLIINGPRTVYLPSIERGGSRSSRHAPRSGLLSGLAASMCATRWDAPGSEDVASRLVASGTENEFNHPEPLVPYA